MGFAHGSRSLSAFFLELLFQNAWRDLNSADLCRRKGFLGGPLLDFQGSMQLLDSSHVRHRDKALLRGILSGGVWNGVLLGKVQGDNVPMSSVEVRTEIVTCFGSALTPSGCYPGKP